LELVIQSTVIKSGPVKVLPILMSDLDMIRVPVEVLLILMSDWDMIRVQYK
jgi:hypothetical protein